MLSPILFMTVCSVLALVAVSVRRIPEGKVYSLRRIGGHTRLLGAGVHLVMPLIESVAHKINLAGNTLNVDTQLSSGQRCRAVLYFQVLDPKRADPVIDGLNNWLRGRATELLKHPAFPEPVNERRQWLKQALNAELRDRGFLVARVDLSVSD
ncbi:MAG: hypothetical protein WB784_01525 [Rhodanobacteraceae bacterium]